ncbi:hypothetical protein Dimus_023998 [Dionaea muscipula]
MAEGNTNVLNEPGKVEPECDDDVREISTVLVEGTIENAVEPDVNGFVTADASYLLVGDSIDTTLVEEMKPSAQNNKLSVPSRYLSGPHMSCHNLCKYGHKWNNIEEKARSPLLRTSSDCRGLDRTKSSLESKRKTVVRRLSFPGTKTERQNGLLVRCPSSKPIAEVKIPKKRAIVESSRHQNNMGAGSFCTNDRKFTTGLEGTIFVYEKPPLKKPESKNPRLYQSLDGLSDMNQKANDIEESKVHQPDDVPEKTLYMIEPWCDENKAKGATEPAMQAKSLPCTHRGKRTGVRHGHMSSSASSSTLKMKSPSPSLPGGEEHGKLGNIHGKRNDTVLPCGKAKATKPKPKWNAELKEKGERGVDAGLSGEKDGVEKRFRRGTGVVLPSPNNGPEKLIFKRGKMLLSENEGCGAAGRRRFKEKESLSNDQSESEAEKVVLRHQETCGTGKGSSFNINNVIEETASELAKTRKSKVKALVGAFESVMSLKNHNKLVATSAS